MPNKKQKIIKPQTLKGFRDFLPEAMSIRNKVAKILRDIFESYGYLELQTPTLEYAATLKGKYGEEAEKLIYTFIDRGGREVGLKYDLTVPLARVMAQYKNLPLPFKRYQIQPVFRAENPQKGRYREIYQCDVDCVGTTSPAIDAEIIAIISESLTALGLNNYVIKVNSRSVLSQLKTSEKVLQIIDKLDKKSEIEVKEELLKNGLSKNQIRDVFWRLDSLKPDDHLKKTIRRALDLGTKNVKFDPRLVRGLDYYTGPIFEAIVTEPKIGSIAGGGRYDKLIKTLGGPDLPAVGTSIGLDRICDVIQELNLWPDLTPTPTKVLIAAFDTQKTTDYALETARHLREDKINVEVYPDFRVKLDKQLKYADRKGIPFAVIIGPEEIKENKVTLKDMRQKTQKRIAPEKLSKELN